MTGRATPMKRSRLRAKGKSELSIVKDKIQARIREIVIARDGTCILRHIRGCTDPVIQADHLITRGNAATFADTRLVVALCRACHGGYKQWNKEKYDALVKTILPKDRVALWESEEAKRLSGATTHYTVREWELLLNSL